ncbi:DUF1513 domain-containing protein [Sinorhizobium medicae]|uniref:Uncharacterized conserved protein UCP028101 n=2 Tax=Sinorhizobium medicae TaxID=110321 RepID=A6UFA8_SINMW|nr:DUF1513 domain-containing protein [Sinorhizobium medicae]ABR62338.1 uncharacterised conserved protein UCP028101 [Sinorhizobium medicae WSM419]MBO1940783.1 DUF1513 domain-containing protein [Sinorhizobium medicae]MBO1964027.1 DUF1513 domain-containing protein [Sinorhizobium medicae]MDX0405780.1 DUF1513 domain-containing protein [Sinorhizobium medicae]MDX0411340.1 DUF1513 domain-containing protein [Sinorhizobium medicae]
MKTNNLIDRRSFVKMAGAAWVATLAPRVAFALERADAVFASGFMAPDGSYGVATLTEEGEIVERSLLPARAHGMAFSPACRLAVAFARRPGTYAMIFSPDGTAEPVVITSAEGRHFFGHGCFSADGRLLYATENDFSANRGMIGIYGGRQGFTKIGEFPTYGIGPHDMTLAADGRTLAIANGGIETHPDFGRTKLNLDYMEPSLTLVDAATGALIEKHALPPSLNRLSTRHVDIGADGRVWFACQYEGARNDLPPLVGHFAKGEDLRFVDLPERTTAALANYVGAIAVNRREGLVGLTSPKGGVAVTLDAKTGAVLAQEQVADAAGVAAASHAFAFSSYGGRFEKHRSPVAWDQHIVRLAEGQADASPERALRSSQR